MKKTLFFVLAVAFCVSLAAQSYGPKDFRNATKQAYRSAHGAEKDYVPSERQSNYKPHAKGFSDPIGETFYTTATNCNARNTVSWSPDGKTCAAVWTTGSEGSPTTRLRGTGINYWDMDSWMYPVSTDRIEEVMPQLGNPGWGMHVFTEAGECVAAHSAGAGGTGGLIINTRAKYGEGEWVQQIKKGPVLDNATTVILWHTMAAVGNTVHLVCVTDNETTYGGISTCPIYYKSTDGGNTWNEPVNLTDFMTPQEIGNVHTGDDFNLVARGQHLVLAFASGRAGYLESKDGGNTWTTKIVYDNNWSWSSSGVEIGPLMCTTTIDAAIDDDGVVHVAFSAQLRARDNGTAPWYYTSYPGYAAIFTWKEGQPTMTEQDMVTISGEDIFLPYYDLPNYLDAPSLTGRDEFNWDDIDVLDQINGAYNGVGYISHPRIIAEKGKVYLMYSSIIEQPMLAATNQFYRGVFLTVSHDNGDTYDQKNNTSWLSYHYSYFLCDWSHYKGPDWTGPIDSSYIVLQVRSEQGYPTMSTNIKNDRIICTWLNDILPFPESADDPWVETAFGVYTANISVDEAGKYKNINEVWRNMWNNISKPTKIENLNIYPNPANNMTTISVGTNNPYTLTVSNIMGQVVHTVKGQQSEVQLNVANYPAGIYIINVKTANATASQKLIVK